MLIALISFGSEVSLAALNEYIMHTDTQVASIYFTGGSIALSAWVYP